MLRQSIHPPTAINPSRPLHSRWMDCYDADNLKYYQQTVKACSAACKLERWLIPDMKLPEYTEETGICLGEGGPVKGPC